MVCKRPSWFSGIGKAVMVESRIGTTYGGSAWHIVGPSGVIADFTVGSGVVSAFLFASRATNATRASNTYSGSQTFVAGTAGGTVPFAFQAGVLNTTPVAHRAEWDGGLFYINSGALFTGSISGTTLTVTAISNGFLQIGMLVYGSSVAANTIITAASGTGGTGTYTVSVSQTVTSQGISGTIRGIQGAFVTGAAGGTGAVPASSSAIGRPGQMAFDGSGTWLYICTGTNTWRRTALTTF
jgi:hypothetical protein